MAAIRAAHPGARITLLTTVLYVGLLRASPWFDDIRVDSRPKLWNLPGLLSLRHQLRGFDRVYDLQTSSRSSRYFALAGRPPWSGIAPGCAFPDTNPARTTTHSRERLAGQLAQAAILKLPVPDLGWMTADISRFGLPARFALLVPGAAAHRPEKRWPAAHFAALARQMSMPCVVVGGAGDGAHGIPGLDLAGQTSLLELAAITAHAALAIGNDTGPMHLAAALNIPAIVLFSGASDPALTAPRAPDGGWPVILREPDLKDLPVARVLAALP
ncbi:MAG: glycosyltransferase family 9 protein [Acidocella sp.]|nr:glycosyltransferase family 9 protein [Acidocella sp.]